MQTPAIPATVRDLAPIALGRTAEVYLLPGCRVLKLFHAWMPPGAAEQEALAAEIVAAAGAPAPACDGLVEVDGRRGIVFAAVRGDSMLAWISRRPWQVRAAGRQLARLQASIAAVPAGRLTSARTALADAIALADGAPDDLREAALAALAHLPDGTAMCHLDFHPDNVILTSSGPVVIDWMTAARGEPGLDVARTLLLLEVGVPPRVSPVIGVAFGFARSQVRRGYVRERLRLGDVTAEQVRAWQLPAAVARYREGIQNEWPALERLARRYAAYPPSR